LLALLRRAGTKAALLSQTTSINFQLDHEYIFITISPPTTSIASSLTLRLPDHHLARHEELDIENVVLPPPALQLEQTEEAERELKKQDGGDEDIIQPPPADDIDSELPAPPSEAERELKQQSEDDDVIRPPAAEDVDADLPAPPFPDLIENVNDKETDSDDSDDCISSNQGEKQSLPVRQISVSPPEEAPQVATESFESKDSKQDLTTSLSVPPTRKTFGDNDSEGGDARTAISENAPRLDMSHLDDTSSEEEDDAVI